MAEQSTRSGYFIRLSHPGVGRRVTYVGRKGQHYYDAEGKDPFKTAEAASSASFACGWSGTNIVKVTVSTVVEPVEPRP
jgi:hypothetical protein